LAQGSAQVRELTLTPEYRTSEMRAQRIFSPCAIAIVACIGAGAVQLRAGHGGGESLAPVHLDSANQSVHHDSTNQSVVWISGYGRSATSTVLSMVGQAKRSPSASGSAFQVFEPCHEGDRLAPWLKERGCNGLLRQIASCNFTGIEWLNGINDKHTTLDGSKYSPEGASSRCAAAGVVAFKTVDQAHDLGDALPILDSNPNFRMLDVVRDPRGILASWKSTWPLDGLLETKEFRHLMTDACETFATNLNRVHPQVHRVVFEELMNDPRKVMHEVYNFLNVSFGEDQLAWINSTFDASDCHADSDQYADCRSNHTATVERWRTVLNETELATFKENPRCQEVAAVYGFDV